MPHDSSSPLSFGRPSPSFLGGPDQDDAQLWAYRTLCVIAALVLPAFGLLYRYTNPAATDPLVGRLLMALPAVGLLGLSALGTRYRSLFFKLVVVYIYAIMVWFVGLASVNAFSPDYAVGLLFTFAILSVSRSIGLASTRPLVIFLLFSVLLIAAPLLTQSDLAISRSIFFACLVSLAVALYIALGARIQAEKNVARSERQHRSFLEEVPVGVYRIAPDGRVLFANEALVDMLGYTSSDELTVDHFMRSASEWTAFKAQFERSSTIKQRQDTWTRRDGTTVHVLESARMVTDREGRVHYYEGIVEDISERERQRQHLVAAKRKAEEMNQLKTAFLANMSHEIRTPLASIIGFAEVLAGEVDDAHLRDFAASIEQSGDRLMETLNSVLDLSKLEADSIQVRAEPTDVVTEIEETVRLLTPRAEEKNLDLRIHAPVPSLRATLDATLLHRITTNLVSNAVKFTEEGGRVTVRVRAEADRIALQVEDTGIGIEEDFLPELFQPFKQESTGDTRRHEGTGLGLTIAHRMAKLMGGSIEVESQKGEGSCFTVRLPRQMEDAPSDADKAVLSSTAADLATQ